MKSIGAISHQLQAGKNMNETVVQLAETGKCHYLDFFLGNLIMESTTFFELIQEPMNLKLLKTNTDLMATIEYLIGELSDPMKWLETAQEAKEGKRRTLLEHRDRLTDQVAVLAAYEDKARMIAYQLDRLNGDDSVLVDDETFTTELVNFIFEFEDPISITDRVKLVYSQLPVRMSRVKVEEWVEKALLGMRGANVRDLENYVTYIKETYYPEGVEGYGKIMPLIAESIDGFDGKISGELTTDTYNELSDIASGISQTVTDSVSLYTFTASVLNNMIGVLSVLDEASKADATQVDRFLDLMAEIAGRRNEEMIIDDALAAELDELSIVFMDMLENNSRLDGLFEQAKLGATEAIIEEGLGEVYDRLVGLHILHSASYFAPLEVESQATEPVNETFLIEKTKELKAYMTEANKGESRMGKRARIAGMLGVLNVIHQSSAEVQQYIFSALDGCRDGKEKHACVTLLRGSMLLD